MDRPSDKAEREAAIRQRFYELLPYWRREKDGALVLGLHERDEEGDTWFCHHGDVDPVVARIEKDEDGRLYVVAWTFDRYLMCDAEYDAGFDTIEEAQRELLAALPGEVDRRVHDWAVDTHGQVAALGEYLLHVLLGPGDKDEQVLDLEERVWSRMEDFDVRFEVDADEEEKNLLAEKPLDLSAETDDAGGIDGNDRG